MQDLTQTLSEFPSSPEVINPNTRPYQPRGGPLELLMCRDPEVVLSGPAGTGKSRAALEKLYILLNRHEYARALVVRKTRASLTQTTVVTFEDKVLPIGANVVWRSTEQEYRFPTKSVMVLGGLDKPTRLMSSEYDIIYVPEATELSEHDWEMINTRLRGDSIPYNQIIADCNPSHPRHWIKERAKQNKLTLLNSKHEDNPILYDETIGDWTPRGKAYLAKLDALSGVRYLRLRKGIWAAAEGIIFDEWEPDTHYIFPISIPPEWRRIRVIDFGYRNPFVCQWWAIDPDGGKAYMYRQIYMSGRTVKSHAAQINAMSGAEIIEATICDHDAEDRATLEENGIITTGAYKDVTSGIDRVKEWFKADRIRFIRGSLVELDPQLTEDKKPVKTEDEFDSYVWVDNVVKEQPSKVDDHGMDALRYAIAYWSQHEEGNTGGIYL